MLIGSGIAAIPFAVMASAQADYDVIGESVNGLNDYLIFKHDGTELSSGDIFAPQLRDSGLGVTVVTEEQLEGKDPAEVAQAIADNTETLDTVILIVDGETDTFHVGSSQNAITQNVSKVLPADAVDDAGYYLTTNSDELMLSYAESGGTVSFDVSELRSEMVSQSTEIQSAIDGLQSENVYVNADTELSNSSDLTETFNGTNVNVVTIPSDYTTFSPNDIGEEILSDDNISERTVIVVSDGEDSDTIHVESHNSGLESEVANLWGGQDTTVEDAGNVLQENASTIIETDDNYATNGEIAMYVGGGIIGFAALVTVVIMGARTINNALKNKKARRIAKEEKEKTYANMLRKKYSSVDEGFRQSMIDLEAMSIKHKNNMSDKDSLTKDIKGLSRRLHDLMDVMEDNKVSDGKRRELEIGYADRLDKLNDLMGDKYYMDIVDNSDYWDEAKWRIHQVRDVIKGMDDKIVEQIKTVNRDHDIDVQVALSALESFQSKDFGKTFENRVKKKTASNNSANFSLDTDNNLKDRSIFGRGNRAS